MKATCEAVMDAAMQLDEEERSLIAASLWESTGGLLPGQILASWRIF